MSVKEIVLGGGCFWCMEAVFQMINGVVSVEPGYSGGHFAYPKYEDVCSDKTGHAEVVRIRYDDSVLDLNGILEVYFASHDPTTLNRQGDDVGSQYRSIIFYTDNAQKNTIESYIGDLRRGHKFKDPIVTEVRKFSIFYPAEDYHHNYFRNNPDKGYCKLVISPKLEKVRKRFSAGDITLKV